MSIQPAETAPTPKTPTPVTKRILPQAPMRAGIVMVAFTAVLYLVNLVNATVFTHGLTRFGLDQYGIAPRQLSGLPGIVWAPLLHGSWEHLFSNTIPVLVFGFLAMAAGIGPWIATTVMIWLISGLGVWATGDSTMTTVGASGIAFGWLAFLLVRGLFSRSFPQILIALVLLAFWGSTLTGLLPGMNPQVSWQAHVFGALGGILAAWLSAKATKGSKPTAPALAA